MELGAGLGADVPFFLTEGPALAEGIGEVDARNLGAQRITCVSVMHSELLHDGPVYSPLSVSKLSAVSSPEFREDGSAG